MTDLLQTQNLVKTFPVKKNFWGKITQKVFAVNQVNLKVKEGERLGLVGESGCGKSTLGRLIMQLYQPDQGTVFFRGENISQTARFFSRKRPEIQMVFQDPYSSLNPRMPIGKAIAEPIRVHRMVPKKQVYHRVIELLELVGLNRDDYPKFPHQFSGGQRQRVGIARALALEPKLLIADEPVSALDVSIQAQIINLLYELSHKLNLTLIFIAHDLKVVQHISHRIAVMYLGEIMELLPSESLLKAKHPYTELLLSAIPQTDRKKKKTTTKAKVSEPVAHLNYQAGCVFAKRCPLVQNECHQKKPHLKEIASNHSIACHLIS